MSAPVPIDSQIVGERVFTVSYRTFPKDRVHEVIEKEKPCP